MMEGHKLHGHSAQAYLLATPKLVGTEGAEKGEGASFVPRRGSSFEFAGFGETQRSEFKLKREYISTLDVSTVGPDPEFKES